MQLFLNLYTGESTQVDISSTQFSAIFQLLKNGWKVKKILLKNLKFQMFTKQTR